MICQRNNLSDIDIAPAHVFKPRALRHQAQRECARFRPSLRSAVGYLQRLSRANSSIVSESNVLDTDHHAEEAAGKVNSVLNIKCSRRIKAGKSRAKPPPWISGLDRAGITGINGNANALSVVYFGVAAHLLKPNPTRPAARICATISAFADA